MGTVTVLPEPAAPDTNRPAEWTRYNEAADLFDRELVASPAYVAKEQPRCNYVARFCEGSGCGFSHCATCPHNEVRHESADVGSATHRRHLPSFVPGGRVQHSAPLGDKGGRY